MKSCEKQKHRLVECRSVAVLDLSNWRGSAPVFCGTPKGEGFKTVVGWV